MSKSFLNFHELILSRKVIHVGIPHIKVRLSKGCKNPAGAKILFFSLKI